MMFRRFHRRSFAFGQVQSFVSVHFQPAQPRLFKVSGCAVNAEFHELLFLLAGWDFGATVEGQFVRFAPARFNDNYQSSVQGSWFRRRPIAEG